MSSWGYSELNSWSQERSSSSLAQVAAQQQQLEQQQELLLASKRLRRDQSTSITFQKEEQPECGLWDALRVPTSDLDATVPDSFQGEAGGLRNRASADLGSRFYVDETSFLDSDEAVSSSCHFALSDVGARIGLFNQHAPLQKEVDESWEAINSLGDMDDIFGNTSSFVQPSSLEQSLSSQTALVASPPTPSSSSVIMLNSTHPLAPAVNDSRLGDFSRNNNMQVNTLEMSSSPSSASTRKATSSSSTYQRADINISPVVQGSVQSPMFGTFAQQQQQQQQKQVSRRLEGYYPGPLPSEPLPLQPVQRLESGGGSYHPQTQAPVMMQVDGLVHPWNERRDANSAATTSSSAGNEASSLEAAVFYQLASSMAKLDVGTRLCIRNALYRLARSASSRNRDENGPGSKYPSQNPEIACLETCTNPIDRTVASLLFYKHDQPQVQQQPTQQTAATATVTPQDTSSGCLSPHSTVSSSSCITQLPELKLRAPPQPSTLGSRRSELPVMMVNSLGNKLPLPPLRYSRNNRRLG